MGVNVLTRPITMGPNTLPHGQVGLDPLGVWCQLDISAAITHGYHCTRDVVSGMGQVTVMSQGIDGYEVHGWGLGWL